MKNCIICNKEFIPTSANQITCSNECRFKRRRETQNEFRIKSQMLHHKICVICGKEFDTYKEKQITCSKECSSKNNLNNINKQKEEKREQNNKKRMENYYNSKTIKQCTCSICGKQFQSDRKVKYCSEECKKQKLKEYNTNYIREKRSKNMEVLKMSKKEEINDIKSDCNSAKEMLMRYADNLIEIGANKEAEQLEKIIIKLEVWQNRQ